MRLGVLGTMVWDRIHARDGRAEPIEEWGGISYALAAAAAAAPADTTIVPIIRVGSDLADRAFDFFRSLPGLDLTTGVRVVEEPNNRVELRYRDRERRFEQLTGGIGPWAWADLAPIVHGVDALYINFISGFELELTTAVALRAHFAGPIYADLHSLLLGVRPDGVRVPRPLEAWREWLRCCDAVQLNEDELATLADAWGDPFLFAAEVVGAAPRLLLVTLGERGAAYFAAPSFSADVRAWRRARVLVPPPLSDAGAVRTQRYPPELIPREGDPTGCGDVWGATCFCALLEQQGLDVAMRRANSAAARNVEHRGATGLHYHLQGRIGT
ncbi:MAG TPA: carbohydrate kinase family protein [Longimicrobiales bacterium]|nr:carbohydrate kinase family protein [Longimicrobiales bacterium]